MKTRFPHNRSLTGVKVLMALFTLHSSLFFSSCSQDVYDKGEGKYSLMRGDFAEAKVNASRHIVSITTDDGDQLPLAEPYTAKWITTADTLYRCMLYYNKVENDQGSPMADMISIAQVPCPTIVPLSEFDKEMRTDPVKFESSWMSKSGKYLNVSLQVKTGVTDDTAAVQSLALICDTIMAYPTLVPGDTVRTTHLRLHHDQGNVPEYYSTQVYLSIPVPALGTDSVRISINTYDGIIEKRFTLKK